MIESANGMVGFGYFAIASFVRNQCDVGNSGLFNWHRKTDIKSPWRQ